MSFNFGVQLRAARALARMEQEELAARSGVSVVTIRTLENSEGPVNARTRTLRALEEALAASGVVFTPMVKSRA
jgi:transcriptional regulator with XRE-family HTH domain